MKRTKKNKIILLFLSLTVLCKTTNAQIISPFNKLEVTDTSVNYSIIVSAHFHGASSNISTFPASSLLANIDTLNSSGSILIMSLGDLFLDVNEKYLTNYKRSLFDKLKVPLFNAVGNHDISNGNMYEKVFGKLFFMFQIRSELYIILNTELNDGSIKDEQLELFKSAMSTASSPGIKNIFIFSHRPVWAEQMEKYKNLFYGNTRTFFGENNFSDEILSLLAKVSLAKNVCWISGSMGGGPASFFYDKDEQTKITFMQTAIRDLPHDAVLQVKINNGQIVFNGISFTGEQLKPIESYDMNFWSDTKVFEKSFNFRLMPLLIKNIIIHYYFWAGVFSSIVLFCLIFFSIRKWKKRK